KLLLLAHPRILADLEQLALAIEDGGDRRIGFRAFHHVFGKGYAVGGVALAFKPRLARVQLVEALGDDGEVGAGHRVVEPDENVALLDAVAVAHAQFTDDAAGRVLDLLDVGVHHDLSWRDDSPRQRHGTGPAADAERKEGDHGQSRRGVAADRPRGVLGVRYAHGLLVPNSGTTLSGRGGGAVSRCRTRDST